MWTKVHLAKHPCDCNTPLKPVINDRFVILGITLELLILPCNAFLFQSLNNKCSEKMEGFVVWFVAAFPDVYGYKSGLDVLE